MCTNPGVLAGTGSPFIELVIPYYVSQYSTAAVQIGTYWADRLCSVRLSLFSHLVQGTTGQGGTVLMH